MGENTEGKVSATVKLVMGERELTIDMLLPNRATRPGELLPLYRGLAGQIIEAAVADAAEEGRTVSCTKGCGACCRQVVPVSELEVRRLHEVVTELPAPRRAIILERFRNGRTRLEEAGLLPDLENCLALESAEKTELGVKYFEVGVACPFLEAEACSIYDERPIVCREYLVTSDPVHCAHPDPTTVVTIRIGASVFRAIRWLTAEPGAERPVWVPLILALDWAEAHPEPAPHRTASELASELFARFAPPLEKPQDPLDNPEATV